MNRTRKPIRLTKPQIKGARRIEYFSENHEKIGEATEENYISKVWFNNNQVFEYQSAYITLRIQTTGLHRCMQCRLATSYPFK